MTEPTYTLDEAKQLLARQQCEIDIQGGLLYAEYNPWGHQRPKRLEVLPLGHDLAKHFDKERGYEGGLKGYVCLRCGAEFVEVVNDEQHQLPAGEPAPGSVDERVHGGEDT